MAVYVKYDIFLEVATQEFPANKIYLSRPPGRKGSKSRRLTFFELLLNLLDLISVSLTGCCLLLF